MRPSPWNCSRRRSNRQPPPPVAQRPPSALPVAGGRARPRAAALPAAAAAAATLGLRSAQGEAVAVVKAAAELTRRLARSEEDVRRCNWQRRARNIARPMAETRPAETRPSQMRRRRPPRRQRWDETFGCCRHRSGSRDAAGRAAALLPAVPPPSPASPPPQVSFLSMECWVFRRWVPRRVGAFVSAHPPRRIHKQIA